jgi:rod shape-determining protein MreD
MMILRGLAVLAAIMTVYCGLALEGVAGGRTLWPHVPAVAIILAAWSIPLAPGVVAGGVIGLCCDALATGPMGPGMVAGVIVTSIGSLLRQRWALESPVAAALFGMATAGGFLAGPLVVTTLLAEVPLPATTLHLHLARAISSAMAATALIIGARMTGRLLKGLTGMLLNV